MQLVFDASFDDFTTIQNVSGIVPASTLQVIAVPQLEQMQRKGGNALGLTPSDGPILLINLNCCWDNMEDDERVLKASANIIRRMQEEANRRNMGNDYLYMNYASRFQDAIEGYGEDAQRLRRVARKYDPLEVFQKLQPGYFKLNGPPNVDWP